MKRIFSASGVQGELRTSDRHSDLPLLVCVHGGGCNSGYFDLQGFSVASAALDRGYPVLLIDRPGYGGSDRAADRDPIASSLVSIDALIESVLADDHAPDGAVMLGHSIGGAVVLSLAALPRRWPLRAVAVSGIGDVPTPAARRWAAEIETRDIPLDVMAAFLLGPEGTYGWQGLSALRRSSEPWLKTEVIEVVEKWPARWRKLAGSIDAPLHVRQAVHETLWEAGPQVLSRMAECAVHAPILDFGMIEGGGHLYEIHKRGHELVASQLDFFDACRET